MPVNRVDSKLCQNTVQGNLHNIGQGIVIITGLPSGLLLFFFFRKNELRNIKIPKFYIEIESRNDVKPAKLVQADNSISTHHMLTSSKYWGREI